jgi:hypothetical protein
MNRQEFAKSLHALAGKLNASGQKNEASGQQDEEFRKRALQLAADVEESCNSQPVKWVVPLDIHGMGEINSR